MKRIFFAILVVTLLVYNVTAALNIDFSMDPNKKEFYDNESVAFRLNITNYEISLAANNVKAVINVENRNETITIGTIAPEKTIIKTFELGKLDAGTHKLDNYVEYELLGITDRTQTKYQTIKVLPSTPITMKSFSVHISQIELSEPPAVGNKFTVNFQVNSSIDTGYLEYGLANENPIKETLKKGINDFRVQHKLDLAGIYLFEIRAYDKDGKDRILKAYGSKSFVLVDPYKFKTIAFEPIITRRGNVSISVSAEPKRDLVQNVGCFLVGGCKGDIYPPVVTIDKVMTQGDLTYYLFTADDSKTGDSSITGCEINVAKRGWERINISYNNTKVQGNYSTQTSIADFTVELKCVDSLLNTGYASIGVKQEFDVLIITNEEKLNKTDNYHTIIYEYLASLEADNLSGAYIDFGNEKTLKIFGINQDAKDPEDIKNAVNLISSKKNTRYLIILGNQEVIPSIEFQSNSRTLSFDDPYADLNGDGVADIPLSRLVGDSDSTETLEKQIKSFSALHAKQEPAYVLTAKSKTTSSGSLLERLADTLCGTPLKIFFYSACNSIPVVGKFMCEGACFVVTNHETLSRLGTAITTGNLSIVQQTIEDGSFFVMLKDGLHLANTGGLIETTDYESGLDFINKVEDVVSIYKQYKQQYGALRVGDIILESKKSGKTGINLKNANIKDLYGLSLEMVNGDPTLRVEIKNE